jgi:NADH-quinone oxidoreductase subunit H
MIDEIFFLLVFPGLLSAVFFGLLYEGLARKIAARMQSRVGPPVWQPFLDFVKLMSKENITPRNGVGFLMTLCPVIAFGAALSAIVFIPVVDSSPALFSGNMLAVIYLLVIYTLSFAVAGWASGSPLGSVGSIRELTLLFSYEFPFIASLLTVGFMTGFTVSPFFAWQFPLAFLAFLASVMASLSLPPFHVAEAEQEIVGGPLAEYSGPRLGMFSLAHAVKFWVLISLGAVMFLGGGTLEWFLVKSLFLVIVVAGARTVFARLRIDQSFRLFWLVIGPLALIDLIRAIFGIWL